MKSRNRKGFTIVELLAVIVLMAIVAVIGFVAVRVLLKSGKTQTLNTKTSLILKNAVTYAEESTAAFKDCYCKVDGNWTNCRIIKVQDLIDAGVYTTTEKCGKGKDIDCVANDLYEYKDDEDVIWENESLNDEEIVLFRRNNQYVAEFARNTKGEEESSLGCHYSNIKIEDDGVTIFSINGQKHNSLAEELKSQNKQYISDGLKYEIKFTSDLPVKSIKYCTSTGAECDQFNRTIPADDKTLVYTGNLDVDVSNPVRLCVQGIDEMRKVTTACSNIEYYDPSKINEWDKPKGTENPRCYINGVQSMTNCPIPSTNRYMADYVEVDYSVSKGMSKYNYFNNFKVEYGEENAIEVIPSTPMSGNQTNTGGTYANEFTAPNPDTISGKVRAKAAQGADEYLPKAYKLKFTVSDTSANTKTTSAKDMNVIIKYQVIYDANGGTGTMTPSIFRYNQTVNLKTNTFTRVGYTYKGWSKVKNGLNKLEPNSGMNYNSNYNQDDTETLYAQWKANQYVVTFDSNGGTPPTPLTIPVTYDSAYGELAKTQRVGYTFEGWYTAKTGGTQITKDTIVKTPNHHTLYAHWKANQYTVTFNANNCGTPSKSSMTVTYDSAYGQLATSTKAGYDFTGWYTAKTGGTQVTSTTIVKTANDHTLYAHCVAKQYTVTFNANGGTTPNPANKQVTFDAAYGGLATTQRTGYTLAGWFNEANGGSEIKDTTKVTTPNDHTLYAHWNAKQYTITLNNQYATTAGTKSVKATYDSTTLSTSITNPKRVYTITFKKGTATSVSSTNVTSTWTFDGWYTPEGVKVIGSDGKLMANVSGYTNASKQWKRDGNATLYAHWSGGTITIPTATRTGYTCQFTGVVNPPTANKEYTATCTAKKYTITLTNTKATTNGSPTSVKATYDSASLSSAITNPKREYSITFEKGQATSISSASAKSTWTFTGWWTASSGGTKVIGTDGKLVASASGHTNASKKWVKAGDATLHSQWSGGKITIPTATRTGYTCKFNGVQNPPEANAKYSATCTANNYTVTFNANNCGTPSKSSMTATYDSTYGTLATISKTGYTFNGWYTAATGGTQVTASTKVTAASNHTLYAHCSAKTYTITLNNKYATTNSVPTSVTATYNSANLSSAITNPKRSYKITFTKGNATSISATSATSTWKFTGWWTASSGGSKVIGTDGKLIANISGYTNASKQWVKAGNVTLYAQWSGGTITIPTATKTGHTCEFSGVVNPPTAVKTYSATCTPNKYTVTFNANGGNAPSPGSKKVTYGSTYGTLATVSKSGAQFGGWYTKANGGTKIESTTKVKITKNQTLYAHWGEWKVSNTFSYHTSCGGHGYARCNSDGSCNNFCCGSETNCAFPHTNYGCSCKFVDTNS